MFFSRGRSQRWRYRGKCRCLVFWFGILPVKIWWWIPDWLWQRSQSLHSICPVYFNKWSPLKPRQGMDWSLLIICHMLLLWHTSCQKESKRIGRASALSAEAPKFSPQRLQLKRTMKEVVVVTITNTTIITTILLLLITTTLIVVPVAAATVTFIACPPHQQVPGREQHFNFNQIKF